MVQPSDMANYFKARSSRIFVFDATSSRRSRQSCVHPGSYRKKPEAHIDLHHDGAIPAVLPFDSVLDRQDAGLGVPK